MSEKMQTFTYGFVSRNRDFIAVASAVADQLVAALQAVGIDATIGLELTSEASEITSIDLAEGTDADLLYRTVRNFVPAASEL